MIAYIEGKLAYKEPTFVIIDVGGVGYHLKISLHTYSALKEAEKCKLLTFMHVKEDAHTLYGFYENAEKKLFLDLISISGVGPGTGLMILSSLSAEELQAAIVQEDVKTIQSIKGIGAKTAQRIILELKDKMKKEGLVEKMPDTPVYKNNIIKNEALSALMTLGIAKAAAEKSIDSILKNTTDTITLEQLIKLALKTT
jgi:holliday junction DNA helicase RuvA